MRILLLSLSFLLAAACTPVTPATSSSPPPSSTAAPDDPDLAPRTPEEAAEAAACPGKSGHLERIGRAQALRCIVTYADAGKVCTDGSQCVGKRCVSDFKGEGAASPTTGACVATNNPFGCSTIIRAGKATAICVD